MVQCSVLRPMGKPIGKTTHRWPGVPKTRTRTQGETHIEEAALRAASTKGGGRLRRPPPFVDSSIWVSPWVRVRVFGTLGQRCVVLPMGFSLGLSTEQSAMCPLSYGCPPGYEPRTIELPLGTIFYDIKGVFKNQFKSQFKNEFKSSRVGVGVE